MDSYKEFSNEIPLNTISSWSRALLEATDWKHIGWTGNPREPLRHWAAYPEVDGLVLQIWNCLKDSLYEEGILVKPTRAILNLYNHGDSSWIHKDSDEPQDWTVVLFLNEHWDINWGGDFVLVEGGEIIKAFAANPGKFVAFKSNMLHGARPVSREAPYPRFGLAFQCKHDNNIQRLSSTKVSSIRSPI